MSHIYINIMKLRTTLLYLAAFFVVASCTNPADDFNIHIKPTFYKYVVEVELEDISKPNEEFNGKVDIELSGEDADAIYNIDGTKNYRINHGALTLMVLKDHEPMEGDPIDFTVSLASNKYKRSEIPVEIGVDDYYVMKRAPMLDLTNLPSGMGSEKATTKMSGDTLSKPMNFKAASADSAAAVEITVPTKTKFKDANGNALSGGDLEADVLCFSDTTKAARKAMPNGTGLIQNVMVNGEVMKMLLPPSATFEINMSIGGSSVKSFEGEGVQLKMPLPAGMYNFGKDRMYMAGDKIGLMSLSDGDQAWVNEPEEYVVMQDTDGKLYVEPTINHLSMYKITVPSDKDVKRVTVTAHADQSNGPTQLTGTITVEAIGDKGVVIGETELHGLFMEPGNQSNPTATFGWSGNVNAINVIGHTWGSNYELSGDLEGPSPEYMLDINIKAKSDFRAGFRLFCGNNNAVLNPPSGVKLKYRPASSQDDGDYQMLHSFKESDNLAGELISVPQLENGQSYDFRALYGEHQIDTADVEMIHQRIYDVDLPPVVCNEVF